MKVNCIYEDGFSWITKGNEYEVVQIFEDEYFIINDVKEQCTYGKDLFEIVGEKENKTMEKTFKEVMEGKEDVVYIRENDKVLFKVLNGVLMVKGIVSWEKAACTTFLIDSTFTLLRKEVTFTEAFKSYEEGKEIESCENKERFSKALRQYTFNCEQIKGKWFINED